MLTRMVSISWPRDPPASASQSAGITGVSHRARSSFYFIELIFNLWYPFFCSVESAIETCVSFVKFLCFSPPSIHLYSSLSCLFSLAFCQTFFSRFLVSLHWIRTCSFSSKKFLITYFMKPLSVSSTDPFLIHLCSLAGEELWSLRGGEAL